MKDEKQQRIWNAHICTQCLVTLIQKDLKFVTFSEGFSESLRYDLCCTLVKRAC